MPDPQTVPKDEFFDSLLGDFLDESGQLLDRLNDNLLHLDEWVRSLDENQPSQCDEDLMNEMFRSAHSLKGLSAMLGLKDINNLTHKVENVFDAARKGQLAVTGDVVETLFQAVDRLVALVGVLKEPDAAAVECESVLEGIGRMLQAAGAERRQSTQADAEAALHSASCGVAEPPRETGPPAVASERTASSETLADAPVDLFAGLEDEAEVSDKYLAIFIEEAELSLDQLTEVLLALEGGGSRDAIETLMVTAHRIKGAAASVGLNRAAKLAHLMEDLLQDRLANGGGLSPWLNDAMLKCTDALWQFVHDLRKGSGGADRFGEVARELAAARNVRGTCESSSGRQAFGAASPPAAGRAAPPLPGSSGEPAAEAGRAAAQAVSENKKTLAGEITFREGLPQVGLKAQLVYEKLSNLGEVRYFEPPAEAFDETPDLRQISFHIATAKPVETVVRHLRIAGVERMNVRPLGEAPAKAAPGTTNAAAGAGPSPPAAISQAPTPRETKTPAPAGKSGREDAAAAPTAPGAGRPADAGGKPGETLRVDIERLDQLMNLAGQLVISKARFAQIGDRLKAAMGNRQTSQVLGHALHVLDRMANRSNVAGPKGQLQGELEALRGQARRIQSELEAVAREIAAMGEVRGAANDLFEAVHQLDRVTDGIQRNVMGTRMVPIGPLFSRFKRVVRDITRTNGKSIRLVINGEKTELDKRMIDELGDPLIHMVRNSADHGIELPGIRQSAGKPREGTIALDAFHRGNNIVIRVSDDGKGLDAERILQKAWEKGLVSPADAEKLSRQQVLQLIWEPGLSTAEVVTEVSGRGMGMDIVRSKIEELTGSIDLESTPGRGTTITIKLPLTLAILPSLMVEIGRDVFAMPIESVVEIVQVCGRDLATVQGQKMAQIRGRVVSVVELDEIFAWHGITAHDQLKESEETTLVIVGERGCEIGMAVGRVLGEEDVVIKSVAENYRNVAGIAGASILGDGRVSLILDPAALIDMASRPGSLTATV